MNKFKDESGTGDNYVRDADDLTITVNPEHTFNTKTGKGTKGYCVSVTGYSALDMDYVPATIKLKSFTLQETAQKFARELVELIGE